TLFCTRSTRAIRSRWRLISCDSNSSRKPCASSALPGSTGSPSAGLRPGVPSQLRTNSWKLTSQISARLTPFMRAGIGSGTFANMEGSGCGSGTTDGMENADGPGAAVRAAPATECRRADGRGASPWQPFPVLQPLPPRLPPDLDLVAVGRRRQHAAFAQQPRTEPLRHLLRRHVGGRDAVDDVLPAEVRERPVDRRGHRLDGIALAPGLWMEGIADLVARPAIRPPRPGLPDPQPGFLLDHGEHGEALQHPRPRHLQEPPPRGAARQLPADVAA